MRAFTGLMLGSILLAFSSIGGWSMDDTDTDNTADTTDRIAYAIFAGGCFWCMEGPFESLDGVTHVEAGYTGGDVPNPSYEQVLSKDTGHYEAVRITYDPSVISFPQLLDVFWRQIDPTDPDGQFADKGPQYQTAIFYHDESEHQQAIASRDALAASGTFADPIVTKILPAKTFYVAEDYHQDYYKTNPLRYKRYRIGSGRAGFLDERWGNDSKTPE